MTHRAGADHVRGRDDEVIRLKVPCSLEYRDLAVRLVAGACKVLRERRAHSAGPRQGAADLDDRVVSAFGEAFSNAVLHGGAGAGADLEIEIEPRDDRLVIRMMDRGVPFEPSAVPPPRLEALPESGLGVYIIRSSVDHVSYEPGAAGAPNVLSLTKHVGNLSREDLGEDTVLRIDGVLDAVTAPPLRPAIDALVEERRRSVTVDLSALHHIDSSGVGVVVSLYKRCREYGGSVRVRGLRDQPLSIFRLLRLDRVFDLG